MDFPKLSIQSKSKVKVFLWKSLLVSGKGCLRPALWMVKIVIG